MRNATIHIPAPLSDTCLDTMHTLGLDPADCRCIASTTKTTVVAPESGLVLMVPERGTCADGVSTQETLDRVLPYLEGLPHKAVGVMLIDHLVDQARTARLAHLGAPATAYWDALVLVGDTPLARAIAAFFAASLRSVHPVFVASDGAQGLAHARRRLQELRAGPA